MGKIHMKLQNLNLDIIHWFRYNIYNEFELKCIDIITIFHIQYICLYEGMEYRRTGSHEQRTGVLFTYLSYFPQP